MLKQFFTTQSLFRRSRGIRSSAYKGKTRNLPGVLSSAFSTLENPAFPRGVTLSYLRNSFIPHICGGFQNVQGKSFDDVYQEFILPGIKDPEMPFTSLMAASHVVTDANTSPKYFLTNNVSSLFLDALVSLESHFHVMHGDNAKKALETESILIEIFSLSPKELEDRSLEAICSRIQQLNPTFLFLYSPFNNNTNFIHHNFLDVFFSVYYNLPVELVLGYHYHEKDQSALWTTNDHLNKVLPLFHSFISKDGENVLPRFSSFTLMKEEKEFISYVLPSLQSDLFQSLNEKEQELNLKKYIDEFPSHLNLKIIQGIQHFLKSSTKITGEINKNSTHLLQLQIALESYPNDLNDSLKLRENFLLELLKTFEKAKELSSNSSSSTNHDEVFLEIYYQLGNLYHRRLKKKNYNNNIVDDVKSKKKDIDDTLQFYHQFLNLYLSKYSTVPRYVSSGNSNNYSPELFTKFANVFEFFVQYNFSCLFNDKNSSSSFSAEEKKIFEDAATKSCLQSLYFLTVLHGPHSFEVIQATITLAQLYSRQSSSSTLQNNAKSLLRDALDHLEQMIIPAPTEESDEDYLHHSQQPDILEKQKLIQKKLIEVKSALIHHYLTTKNSEGKREDMEFLKGFQLLNNLPITHSDFISFFQTPPNNPYHHGDVTLSKEFLNQSIQSIVNGFIEKTDYLKAEFFLQQILRNSHEFKGIPPFSLPKKNDEQSSSSSSAAASSSFTLDSKILIDLLLNYSERTYHFPMIDSSYEFSTFLPNISPADVLTNCSQRFMTEKHNPISILLLKLQTLTLFSNFYAQAGRYSQAIDFSMEAIGEAGKLPTLLQSLSSTADTSKEERSVGVMTLISGIQLCASFLQLGLGEMVDRDLIKYYEYFLNQFKSTKEGGETSTATLAASFSVDFLQQMSFIARRKGDWIHAELFGQLHVDRLKSLLEKRNKSIALDNDKNGISRVLEWHLGFALKELISVQKQLKRDETIITKTSSEYNELYDRLS